MVGVVDPEYRVGAVPVKAVHSNGADMDSKQGDEADGEEGGGLDHGAAQGTRLLSLLNGDLSQTIVTSLLSSSDTTLSSCFLKPGPLTVTAVMVMMCQERLIQNVSSDQAIKVQIHDS